MKRDWSGVMFGVVVGLSIGLLLCNVVHAADAGSRCQNLTNESARCDGTESPIVISPCLATMEAAMRAREEWAALTDERDRWVLIAEGTATTTFLNPTITYDPFIYPEPMPEYHYKPDRRTDEERLADRQKELDEEKIALAKRREEQRIEAEKKQEKAGKIIVFKTQWELGKACWRKP